MYKEVVEGPASFISPHKLCSVTPSWFYKLIVLQQLLFRGNMGELGYWWKIIWIKMFFFYVYEKTCQQHELVVLYIF
jgi:hypothetical protein